MIASCHFCASLGFGLLKILNSLYFDVILYSSAQMSTAAHVWADE